MGVNIRFDGYKFEVDLIPLELNDFDVILCNDLKFPYNFHISNDHV